MQPSCASLSLSLLLCLGIGPAGAQTFYNEDGVQLSASARVIDPGAATCRVREERHTAEQYERLKPNEGQPLNVWRVELVVANYSGKALDYLNAHLNVESDWPPCDHWHGPEGRYGAPVVWTGPLMSIQDVGIVEPGEEVRETAFLLAWHEEEPALGRWDIDYDFAASPPAGGAAAETRPESTDMGRATAAAEREAAGPAEAPLAGRNGRPAGIPLEDTCAGKAVGSLCWMELSNQPGCYVWNQGLLAGWHLDYLRPVADPRRETVTWTGGCSGGRASGTGERTWSYTGDDGNEFQGSAAEGSYSGGKENGHWTVRYTDGEVQEGPFVDGKAHGHWTERNSSGIVEEGSYVDGKRHGHWIGGSSGTVEESSYVDGKRHGRWTTHWADGNVTYVCYSNGDRVVCP